MRKFIFSLFLILMFSMCLNRYAYSEDFDDDDFEEDMDDDFDSDFDDDFDEDQEDSIGSDDEESEVNSGIRNSNGSNASSVSTSYSSNTNSVQVNNVEYEDVEENVNPYWIWDYDENEGKWWYGVSGGQGNYCESGWYRLDDTTGNYKYYYFDDEGYCTNPEGRSDRPIKQSSSNSSQGMQTSNSQGNIISDGGRGNGFNIKDIATPSSIESGSLSLFSTQGTDTIDVYGISRSKGDVAIKLRNDVSSYFAMKCEKDINSSDYYLKIGGTTIFLEGVSVSDTFVSLPKQIASILNTMDIERGLKIEGNNIDSLDWNTEWLYYGQTKIMPIWYRFTQEDQVTYFEVVPIFLYKLGNSTSNIYVDRENFVFEGKPIYKNFTVRFNSSAEFRDWLYNKLESGLTIDTALDMTVVPLQLANYSSNILFSSDGGEFKKVDLSEFTPSQQLKVNRFQEFAYYTDTIDIIDLDDLKDPYIPDMKYSNSTTVVVKEAVKSIKEVTYIILTQTVPIFLALYLMIIITLDIILSVYPLVKLIGKYFDLYKIFTFGNVDYTKATFINMSTFALLIFVLLVVYCTAINLIFKA